MSHGIKIGQIQIIHLFIFPLLIILYFSNIAHSTIIWHVGIKGNEKWEESLFKGQSFSTEKPVIVYQVPQGWESAICQNDPNLGDLPFFLYPYQGETNCPQEIRIDFNYPIGYANTFLRIIASVYKRGASQNMEVYKGPNANEETFIGKKLIDLPYYIFHDFPLGEIKKGFREENRIIIRNIPNPEQTVSDTSPIIFAGLYLSDNDINDTDIINEILSGKLDICWGWGDIISNGIYGRVIDFQGKGINGLKISVKNEEKDFYKSTPTVSKYGYIFDQGDGYFHFIDVSFDFLPLELNVSTYDSSENLTTIEITSEDQSGKNIILDEITLSQLLDTSSHEYYKRIEEIRDILPYIPNQPSSGDHDINLPPEGDYDGDGISNWDEVLYCLTPLYIPTVPLSVSEGISIYLFPSIIEIPNIFTISSNSSQVYYYYDPDSISWKENPIGFKQNCFNAIDTSKQGMLYLNLTSEKIDTSEHAGTFYPNLTSEKPVLCLKGFLNGGNPPDCLDKDLFDPNYFDPNVSTLKILDNPNLTNIQAISHQGSQNGKWESSYRFFGKPAGKDICIKSHEVYIVTKGRE